MSNTPLSPEELLSALLDGQLTGDEKMRAESLLDESSLENQRYLELWSSLKKQSRQIRELPKFELPQEFASRVLSAALTASRTTEPGSETDFITDFKTRPSLAVKDSARDSRFDLNMAIGAVATLAALLLLTLFMLPQPAEDEVTLKIAQPEIESPSSESTPADEAMAAFEKSNDSDANDLNADDSREEASGIEIADGEADRPANPIVEKKAALPTVDALDRKAAKAPLGLAVKPDSKPASNKNEAADRDAVDGAAKGAAGAAGGSAPSSAQRSQKSAPVEFKMNMRKSRAAPRRVPPPANANPIASSNPITSSNPIASNSPESASQFDLQTGKRGFDQIWILDLTDPSQLVGVEQSLARNGIKFESKADLGLKDQQRNAGVGSAIAIRNQGIEAVYIQAQPEQMRLAMAELSNQKSLVMSAVQIPTSQFAGSAFQTRMNRSPTTAEAERQDLQGSGSRSIVQSRSSVQPKSSAQSRSGGQSRSGAETEFGQNSYAVQVPGLNVYRNLPNSESESALAKSNAETPNQQLAGAAPEKSSRMLLKAPPRAIQKARTVPPANALESVAEKSKKALSESNDKSSLDDVNSFFRRAKNPAAVVAAGQPPQTYLLLVRVNSWQNKPVAQPVRPAADAFEDDAPPQPQPKSKNGK